MNDKARGPRAAGKFSSDRHAQFSSCVMICFGLQLVSFIAEQIKQIVCTAGPMPIPRSTLWFKFSHVPVAHSTSCLSIIPLLKVKRKPPRGNEQQRFPLLSMLMIGL